MKIGSTLLLLALLLGFLSCTTLSDKAETIPFEQEKVAILQILNNETKSAFRRDYEGWAKCWLHGQDPFTIEEDGLAPAFAVLNHEETTTGDLYKKMLAWIVANEKAYKLTIDHKIENERIVFTRIKGNAVNLGERYFNAKYTIHVEVKEDQWIFKPTAIELKVNSKYDMGWEPFDLTNGSSYFKKGKPIRKYKAYLNDLVAPLNELYHTLKQ